MTSYPAAGDYYKAVQAPPLAFTVPQLQQAEFVWDALGPTLARGSSAVVFQAAVSGRAQALRCYIRNDASSRERYSALGDFLAGCDLDPFVSAVTWTDSAIRVNGATWPVLRMPWIDGRTLNEYVDFLVTGRNAEALGTLAAKWRELIALLQSVEFAHGDLQHGNVLVDQGGTLRLVDFDGIWIPQLAGMSEPTEYGHPNYQHPTRRVWDRWLDTFSALVIYLSLVALAKDPSLWLALYNSKNLLFSKSDFFPPFESQVWKQLAALRDPQVSELARRLRECCDPFWVSTGSLEMLLDPRPVIPAPPLRGQGADRGGHGAEPRSGQGPERSGQGAEPRSGQGPESRGGREAEPRSDQGTQPPRPAALRWWEQPPVTSSRPPSPPSVPAAPSVPVTPAVPAAPMAPKTPATPQVSGVTPVPVAPGAPAVPSAPTGPQSTGASLPTPPPLSAPLGTAGTGPMTQLRRTMAPPDTAWWTTAGGSPTGAPPPPPPSPSPARPPALLRGSSAAAVALGVGVAILIIGAAMSQGALVFIGLALAAGGIYLLVSRTGR
jgi:eukaryotic-like serine/threonine-protein kinase